MLKTGSLPAARSEIFYCVQGRGRGARLRARAAIGWAGRRMGSRAAGVAKPPQYKARARALSHEAQTEALQLKSGNKPTVCE